AAQMSLPDVDGALGITVFERDLHSDTLRNGGLPDVRDQLSRLDQLALADAQFREAGQRQRHQPRPELLQHMICGNELRFGLAPRTSRIAGYCDGQTANNERMSFR